MIDENKQSEIDEDEHLTPEQAWEQMDSEAEEYIKERIEAKKEYVAPAKTFKEKLKSSKFFKAGYYKILFFKIFSIKMVVLILSFWIFGGLAITGFYKFGQSNKAMTKIHNNVFQNFKIIKVEIIKENSEN